MCSRATIRLRIVRAMERQVREGRPEISVLIVALCSAAVTVCTALIASILLAAVVEMQQPSEASYWESRDAEQQESSLPVSADRVLRSIHPEK
jgi:hypothetical protein